MQKPLQILIADDSLSQRKIIRAIIEEIPDCQVYEAADGSWALQWVRQLGHVDLLITDLNMPGMDGIELMRNISTHTDIPALILISGHAPELLAGCLRAARELGIKHIGQLAKPIQPQALTALTKQLTADLNNALQHRHADTTTPYPLVDIISGLAQNQFCSYFQPIFDLTNYQLLQYEALARWIHPQHGVIGPTRFVSRLDNEGHLTLLTRRVVQTGLDLLSNRNLPDQISLSVNLSRSQLFDDGLMEWILHEVQLRQIAPRRVVLEITEDCAFTNLAQAMTIMLRLRLQGFGIALDDFGIGHTTMDLLKELPITELKLDQSLIMHISQDDRAQSIASALIQLADKLKLKVVAEGVENQADLEYLRTHFSGTPLLLQGFLLGKPMPAIQALDIASGGLKIA